MVLKMILALALTASSVACAEETTLGSRRTRSPFGDSTRPVGNDDLHGGSDMPGKGRAGEHDRHSMIHK